jgi:hypothetical protein
MPCESGILVWWGKFVDIGLSASVFFPMWCLNKVRRFMSGAGIPDNCQISVLKVWIFTGVFSCLENRTSLTTTFLSNYYFVVLGSKLLLILHCLIDFLRTLCIVTVFLKCVLLPVRVTSRVFHSSCQVLVDDVLVHISSTKPCTLTMSLQPAGGRCWSLLRVSL